MKIKSLLAIVLITGGIILATPKVVNCQEGACDWELIQAEGCGWFEWAFCTSFCIVDIFGGGSGG